MINGGALGSWSQTGITGAFTLIVRREPQGEHRKRERVEDRKRGGRDRKEEGGWGGFGRMGFWDV